MNIYDYFVDDSRFLEVAHILIDEGLQQPLQKAHILPEFNLTEKVLSTFEKRLPLGYRLRVAAEKSGVLYALFAKYVASRHDVFNQHICSQLVHTHIPNSSLLTNAQAKKEITTINKKFSRAKVEVIQTRKFVQVCKLTYLKKTYYAQFVPLSVRKNLLIDLETLLGFARIFDEMYPNHYNVTIKNIVHEFAHELHHTLNFRNQIEIASESKSLPIKTVSVNTQLSKPHLLISTYKKGTPLDTYLQSENKKHIESIIEQIADFFFHPLFQSQLIPQQLNVNNIIVTHKHELLFLQTPTFIHTSKWQVKHLMRILNSIVIHDYHKCVQYFLSANEKEFVSKAQMTDIITDVKTYFHKNKTLNLSQQLFDIISIYQKHRIPIPQTYTVFAQHYHLLESLAKQNNLQSSAKRHISEHIIKHLEDEIQADITLPKEEIKKEQAVIQQIMKHEIAIEKIEILGLKIIYTILFGSILISGTLMILFGNEISPMITLPFFILSYTLLVMMIHQNIKKLA